MIKWRIEKILAVARQLQRVGATPANSKEQIAAAFALNRQDHIPSGYTMIDAWEKLDDEWKAAVKCVRQNYQHCLEEDRVLQRRQRAKLKYDYFSD